jgi:hypothetical protein
MDREATDSDYAPFFVDGLILKFPGFSTPGRVSTSAFLFASDVNVHLKDHIQRQASVTLIKPAVKLHLKIQGSWHNTSDQKQRSDRWMAEV